MHEAVFRRYKRLLAEEKPLPQLIFIDGGKGQLSAAAAAMQALDLEAIMLVGLVKPPKRHNEISHLLDLRPRGPADPVRPQFARVPA